MTQHPPSLGQRTHRCELLSNLYLCIGWHSIPTREIKPSPLWIAFKFVSLYRMTQLYNRIGDAVACCELLSNLYLCIGWHSWLQWQSLGWRVVNCFQICIFVSDDTAKYFTRTITVWLWIAFKFVSLYRMTQLNSSMDKLPICCELLSNLYLCIGWHSHLLFYSIGIIVVNCFQICIFVSDDTATSKCTSTSD